jgi:hypothetical protein
MTLNASNVERKDINKDSALKIETETLEEETDLIAEIIEEEDLVALDQKDQAPLALDQEEEAIKDQEVDQALDLTLLRAIEEIVMRKNKSIKL